MRALVSLATGLMVASVAACAAAPSSTPSGSITITYPADQPLPLEAATLKCGKNSLPPQIVDVSYIDNGRRTAHFRCRQT